VSFVKRVQNGIRERKELSDVPISLSFGIAEMDLEQSEEAAITTADAALYAAKNEGRDRYCLAQ
jgi:PleD family two-component response regulator